MSDDNLSAVLYGIEDLRLEQRPIPAIKDDEVLLRMDCVGICGTDVHYLENGRVGDFIVTNPIVMGHEAAGIVAKIGKNVKNLVVGDRVAVEPAVPCRICDLCKIGRYNLCKKIVCSATPPYNGSLARYYAHAADFCFKLPDHVSMEEGVLLEPLAVGVHACRRAEISLGSEVLILGAGPIGLVTVLTAKAMGASKIMVTDLVASRLEMAMEFGATHTYLANKKSNEHDAVEKIHEIMGTIPAKTVDCSGVEATARLAVLATKDGGCVVMVGLGPADIKIPLVSACVREIDIRGSFRFANDYPGALALIASGKIDIMKKLMTHHFDLTETAEAFNTSRHGLGGAIKVMIHCQPRNTNNINKI